MKTIFIKSLRGILLGLAFAALLLPRPALAIPTLQLDILGGTYDPVTETIVTASDAFTLYAYATPGSVSAETILNSWYFLSVALTPKTGPAAPVDVGNFTLDGATKTIGDMTYGTPPLDATANPLLGSHGIYETFFLEVKFQFDDLLTATPYNTQDFPGLGPDTTGSGMFYIPFELNIAGLNAGYELHFDLYNTKVKRDGDITLDDFAPFSHDAGTGTPPIPEPATLILLGSGLLGLAYLRRRK